MEKAIIFSIIIPHKNIPNLLQRCLDSIPNRDDIQIIVTDDNSDILEVNGIKLNDLPEKYPYVEWSWGKNENGRKGAGYARNLGLERAKGKWLVFADADDFFHKNLDEALNKYLTSEYDLVFFGMNSFYSDDTLKICHREGTINEDIKKAINGDIYSRDKIKYRFLYPSCKLIKRSLVEDNNIKFDEIPASNDTMFSVKISSCANRVTFDNSIIYCLTYRNNSLVTSYKYEYLKSRLLTSFELYKHLKSIKKEKFAQSALNHWLQIRHCNMIYFIRDFFLLLLNYPLKKIIKEFIALIKLYTCLKNNE
jgi:glycosyltransferase involved in cell wall biosynthesis